MIINNFCITILLLASYAYGTNPPSCPASTPPAQNVHFYVSLSNTQDSRTATSSSISAQQVIQKPDGYALKKIPELQKAMRNELEAMHSHASGYSKHLLWFVPALTIAGSYAYYCYAIIKGNYYLKRPSLWSNWYNQLSFDQVLKIPQEDFSHQLLTEIHHRYARPETITDIIGPFTTFIRELEMEENTISTYQKSISWMTSLYIDRLFPINQDEYQKVAERLQRLAYYKNVFKTWAAHYALQQAQNRGISEFPDTAELEDVLLALQKYDKMVVNSLL